jgi:hypothetical protein
MQNISFALMGMTVMITLIGIYVVGINAKLREEALARKELIKELKGLKEALNKVVKDA